MLLFIGRSGRECRECHCVLVEVAGSVESTTEYWFIKTATLLSQRRKKSFDTPDVTMSTGSFGSLTGVSGWP